MQIRIIDVLPAGTVAFRTSSAAFGVTGIAELSLAGQQHSPGLVNCPSAVVSGAHQGSLIALAVVIRAYVIILVRDVSAPASGGQERLALPHPRNHPATGNNRVCLKQFQRCARLHLGRNHAEQIIFQTYAVDCRNLVSFNDKAQSSRIFQRPLPLPMEAYAYSHVMQNETRLRKQGGTGHGIKIEFIIERSVVIDASVAPAHLLAAGTVRNYFKFYFLRRDNSYIDFRSPPSQTIDYQLFFLFAYGHLRKHFLQLGCACLFKIALERCNKNPGHIRGSRTYRKVVLPFCIIVMRTDGAAHYDHSPEFAVTVPAVEVERRFFGHLLRLAATQKPVEQFGQRL